MKETNTELYHVALSLNVLAVATVIRVNGVIVRWFANIDAVRGLNHNIERKTVSKMGAQLNKRIAVCIFYNLPENKFNYNGV